MAFRVVDTLVPGAEDGKKFPVVDVVDISINKQYLNDYLDNLNTTITTLSDAVDKLTQRITALEKENGTVATLDKTTINSFISQADGLEEDEYTISSWESLDVAYKEAENARDNATTQGELDEAASALEQAINNLIKRITFAISGVSYTAEPGMTWFAWADSESYNTSNNPKITCSSGNAFVYCGELRILSGTSYVSGNQQISSNGIYTIETQSTEVDKTDLETAIGKAEQIINSGKEADYTSESWTNLENALEDAQTIFQRTSSTQEEVDTATDNLNDACDSLVPKTEPEEPTGIVDTIIVNKTPMYSISTTGELVETPFKLIDGDAAPTESGFYTITDDQGNVIEAGYQDLQVINDEMYYMIALPKEIDYNTMVEVESYDPDEKIWVDADIALTSDPNVVSVLCEEVGVDITHIDTDKYTVWVQEDICTGSIIRYRIIEEN